MDAIEDLLSFGMSTKYENLPEAVIERSRLAILDTLGAMIAGIKGADVQQLSDLVSGWGGRPDATAVSCRSMIPLPHAAFLNGVAARAWDLDDVHEQNTCHINVNVVPTALALAEARPQLDGRGLLAAVSIGAEVICRISGAPRVSFSETGSSMSYQCGFYGAALVAARLLGLSRDKARHALGIAHARMAGNQQGYLAGASTIRLMQGVAVEGGVLSALMAERNLTGSAEILEGRFGYYDISHKGMYDRSDLVDGLGGDTWHMLEPSIKPAYPCCKYTHGPIEAAIQAAHAFGASTIEKVIVRVTNREVHDLVCETRHTKWNPKTLSECQFSLPFAVAHAIVNKRVDLDTFSPLGMEDPKVRALLPRIDVDLDISTQGTGRGKFPMPGTVSIHGEDGHSVQRTVEYVRGHPKNPMDFNDVAEKFRICARLGLPGWDPEPLIRNIRCLEQLGDTSELMRACSFGYLNHHTTMETI